MVNIKQVAKSLIGILLSVYLIYYFHAYLPQNTFNIIFSEYQIFIFSIPLLSLAYILRGYKSLILFNYPKKNNYELFSVLYKSIALNNILPFRSGDVFRFFYLKKKLNFQYSKITSVLLLERIIDLFSIVILLLIFSFFFSKEIYEYLIIFLSKYNIFNFNFFIFSFIFLLTVLLLTYKLIKKYIFVFVSDLFSYNFLDISKYLLITLFQWIIEIIFLSLLISLLSKQIDDSFIDIVTSSFFCNLSTLVPSAPGYFGTFESIGVLPYYLKHLFISDSIIFFVLQYHLVIWFFSTMLGFLFFIKDNVIKR